MLFGDDQLRISSEVYEIPILALSLDHSRSGVAVSRERETEKILAEIRRPGGWFVGMKSDLRASLDQEIRSRAASIGEVASSSSIGHRRASICTSTNSDCSSWPVKPLRPPVLLEHGRLLCM